MAIWNGYDPSYRHASYSIRQYANDVSASGFTNENGEQVPWWEIGDHGGVKFTPDFCQGVKCEDQKQECTGCIGCEPEDGPPVAQNNCFIPVPDAVHFQPFWVSAEFKCDPVGREPNELYRRLDNHLDQRAWSAIARRYHLSLQGVATDLSNGDPTCYADAIGTLTRARGVQGVHPGVLVVPGYALAALEMADVVSYTASGLPVGPGRIPVVVDNGFPTSGPGGAPAPTSGAWVYITHSAPYVAMRDVRHPHGGPFDFNNARHRQKFFIDDCDGPTCFTPKIKRQAIIVHDPCGTYAIPIEVCRG